jgi:TonB family protein
MLASTGRRGVDVSIALRCVPAVAVAGACWMAAMAGSGPAQAQVPPAAAASEVSAEQRAERARREAERVFQWIRLHGDLPRRRAGDDKAVATVPAASTPAPGSGAAARPALAPASAPGPARTARAVPAPPAAAPAAPASAAPAPAASAAPGPVQAPAEAEPAASDPAADTAAAPAPYIGRLLVAQAGEDLVVARQVGPEFQPVMMRALRKGMALVRFAVQPDGSVSAAEVVRSSHDDLNAAALAAVAQWRFQPIARAQIAVVEVGFGLD